MFWSEIEHQIIYKNSNYVIEDKFLKDIMNYIKNNLTMIDNQLLTVLNHVEAKKSKTNASNGNVLNYKLPSGIDVQWTGLLVKNLDGSRFHGIGVIPDIEIYPTIKGIQEGRDEVLEKALEYLRQ